MDELILYTDEANLDLAESWYEYHFENDYRSVLVDQNIWINKEGDGYIEDKAISGGEPMNLPDHRC